MVDLAAEFRALELAASSVVAEARASVSADTMTGPGPARVSWEGMGALRDALDALMLARLRQMQEAR